MEAGFSDVVINDVMEQQYRMVDKLNVKYDAKSRDTEIDELINYSKIDVPLEFIEIIKEKTELEIMVKNKKYIRIWGGQVDV